MHANQRQAHSNMAASSSTTQIQLNCCYRHVSNLALGYAGDVHTRIYQCLRKHQLSEEHCESPAGVPLLLSPEPHIVIQRGSDPATDCCSWLSPTCRVLGRAGPSSQHSTSSSSPNGKMGTQRPVCCTDVLLGNACPGHI